MKVRIGQGSVEVVKGDITDQDVDAIVNAANNHLWMGAGVAGAIKKKGGQEIETEAVRQGPVDIGAAVITTGGNLKAKFVIHAAGMGQDLRTDEEKVRSATRSSLKLADENKVGTLAFPAIGTGVGGFSIHQCAQTMINESIDFLSESKTLKLVRFVLFDDAGFQSFEEELRIIFSSP